MGVDGIVGQCLHHGVLLEHNLVDVGVVALLEDALLHADAYDGVGIEGGAQCLGPLVEGQLLHAVLHGLHVGLGLHMVGHALEAGLVPAVVGAVSGEVGGQSGLVLGGLVPHEGVADFIEQQSVVVLLYEVAQVHVGLRQRVGLLRHQLLHGESAVRCLHLLCHLLLGYLVAHVALLHEAQYGIVVLLKGFQHLALLHEDDVVAERRLHHLRHLSRLQLEGHVLVLLHELSVLHEGQLAALACRAGVLRQACGEVGEVGAALQGLVDGVDAHLGLVPLSLRGLLVGAYEDVCRLDESVGTNALHRLVVDLAGLGLHVLVGDEHGQHLLVAVLGKLLLVAAERVVAGVEGGKDLQLIVDEQVDVFFDALLVDDAFRVVLVVGVFKLRAWHGLAVDHHDDRVVLHRLLRPCRSKGDSSQESCQNYFLHGL